MYTMARQVVASTVSLVDVKQQMFLDAQVI